MIERKLSTLKPHETMKISGDIEVTRVPGGYIYHMKKCSTFVPKCYEAEFDYTTEEARQYYNELFERNLGEDWTKAKKSDIIDVILGEYLPF